MSLALIPPYEDFLDQLAQQLLARHDRRALADVRVILPTRRAARRLAERFAAQAPEGLMLPRIGALGGLDEDDLSLSDASGMPLAFTQADSPPVWPALKRLLLLAQLIRKADQRLAGRDLSLAEAVALAEPLLVLLDQADTEGVALSDLNSAELAPELAEHWQDTGRFLELLAQAWPPVEQAQGYHSAARLRVEQIGAQAKSWQDAPPPWPVYLAGSTGSIPAVADLMDAIARAPLGWVVLPALDLSLPEDSPLDPQHPQAGLHALLQRNGWARDRIEVWSHNAPPARAQFIQTALAPPAEIANPEGTWRGKRPKAQGAETELWDRLHIVEAADEDEEARVVALAAREALEDPQADVGIITPDRALARRIIAQLGAFGVRVNDSAGVPLHSQPAGALAWLSLACIAEHWAAVPLLALLKHPLVRLGQPPAEVRRLARQLELHCLRGRRPAPGFTGLNAAVDTAKDAGRLLVSDAKALSGLLQALHNALQPLQAYSSSEMLDLTEIARLHQTAVHQLTLDQDGIAQALWDSEAGVALAELFNDLSQQGVSVSDIDFEAYSQLFTQLLAARIVRPLTPGHPRLSLLGTLEARLLRFDRVIMAGLNAEVWPARARSGPWVNRRMRQQVGLPLPERRIGLAAHDFVMAVSAAARDVILTYAAKRDDSTALPNRWLERIEALRTVWGWSPPPSGPWRDWAQQALAIRSQPQTAPKPCPPLAARPTRWRITDIATLIADPYRSYAQKVLKLTPLESLEPAFAALERGRILHAALETFIRRYGTRLPDDPAAAFIAQVDAQFDAWALDPVSRAFWRPRAVRLAQWLALEEPRRRPLLALFPEVKVSLEMEIGGLAMQLSGRLDRIEQRQEGLTIIDYKTGTPPSKSRVEAGLEPQLTLAALSVQDGETALALSGQAVTAIEYWQIGASQSSPAKVVNALGKDVDMQETIKKARMRLTALLSAYQDSTQPYLIGPLNGTSKVTHDPYEHLKRRSELGL